MYQLGFVIGGLSNTALSCDIAVKVKAKSPIENLAVNKVEL